MRRIRHTSHRRRAINFLNFQNIDTKFFFSQSKTDKLEDFFGRKVDLLTLRSVKNPVMREEIERTKVLVYDGSQAQVLV